jgi:tetratricopeptide (TPR) repeat protein
MRSASANAPQATAAPTQGLIARARLRRSVPGPWWTSLVAGLVLLLRGASLEAADSPTPFDDANRLYEQGQYADAVQAYQAILAAGWSSPALWFNLGNACFKNGQIGHAIVNFRRALAEAPRDPDIRANLQFARNSVTGGNSVLPGRWQQWLGRLTLDEAALLATASLWLWFGLLILRQLQPATRPATRSLTRIAGLCAFLLLGGLALLWHQQRSSVTAIVIVPETTIHFGPLDESQRAFTARDGLELAVTDRQGDWLQVTDASRRVGWLKREQVALFP